ncbi:hypothetical protein VTJ04DRAFT_10729 [Mycothermus thermophilus]|uniref:uncharacterized protein n=1 Tax=Humicola insolens TaxID=85995 RepID=UPI003743E725
MAALKPRRPATSTTTYTDTLATQYKQPAYEGANHRSRHLYDDIVRPAPTSILSFTTDGAFHLLTEHHHLRYPDPTRQNTGKWDRAGRRSVQLLNRPNSGEEK